MDWQSQTCTKHRRVPICRIFVSLPLEKRPHPELAKLEPHCLGYSFNYVYLGETQTGTRNRRVPKCLLVHHVPNLPFWYPTTRDILLNGPPSSRPSISVHIQCPWPAAEWVCLTQILSRQVPRNFTPKHVNVIIMGLRAMRRSAHST